MSAPLHVGEADELRALLDWYRHIGVESIIDEGPHDRFAECAHVASTRVLDVPRPAAPASPIVTPARPSLPGPLATDAARVSLSAHETAAAASSLEELRAALEAFDGCPLKYTATNLVFADGNARAPLMILGEAPGAEEDASGKPFVGRAGQLLDKMLAAIGLDRTSVYIANVLPWRPPGNRDPSLLEVAACLPFTRRQVELVAPRWLITVGKAATHTMTGTTDPISRMRGRWLDSDVGSHRVRLMPMLHPAYLLRTPGQKRAAWTDLRKLRRVMDAAALDAGGGSDRS